MIRFPSPLIAAIWARRAFEAARRFANTLWLAAQASYLDTDKAHFETEMAEAFECAPYTESY
jgi:dsRNA-specific ribonuclease